MTSNEIHIGNIKPVGGLKQRYQDVTILLKLGQEPKIGLQMILKDNLSNDIMQKPIQIMFNENELKELDKLIEFLKGGKELFLNYQRVNK